MNRNNKKKPRDTGQSSEPDTNESRRRFLKIASLIGGSSVASSCAVLGLPRVDSVDREMKGWPESYGVLHDITKCVGCRKCEEGCNKANDLIKPETPFDSGSVFDTKRRPTPKAYTVVNRYENPKDKDSPLFRKIQCNHCKEPACATACPIHAYRKTKEGPVLYDPALCFGCRYCMIACPFHVPAYEYENLLEPKIVKCTMCHDRIKKGMLPACVDACPTGAVTFGKRDELLKLAKTRIKGNPDHYIPHIYGEHEVGGTNWLYISSVPFEKIGFPTHLPKKPLIEITKGYLSAVPLVFVIWPALFGMCYAALSDEGKENLNDEEKPETAEGER